MIAQVIRGSHMPDLVSYLFGPGRFNEHVNQHLVAGYGDAVFTADDKLWQDEPGTQRHLHNQARQLGWQVEYPHWRWGTEVPHGYVWHCSLSLKAEEGQLTDAQWSQAAHQLIDKLGFCGADGKAPCRWIAVRHGLSHDGNDHIHIAVNLVREDGTKASTWSDYHKAGQACAMIEQRFGLQPVPGRITGRSVPEPSRKDREISAARGDPEPLRVYLERTVRGCAAAATSEAQFVAIARARGLMIRPRYSDSGATAVVGYSVGDPRRQGWSRRTGGYGPVWFGGGTLASDLSLPSVRLRWETGNATQARVEALAAWSAATSLDLPKASHPSVRHAQMLATDPTAAADLLAAAAAGFESGAPGPLSQAARLMAKAAQQHPAPPRSPALAAAVSDMAATFLSVTSTARLDKTHAVLDLMTEVAALVDACAAKAQATRTATTVRQAQQAGVLVRASLTRLTQAADRQARSAISNVGIDRKEITMTDLTHEDELLAHMTAAGVLTARIVRAAVGQPRGESADVRALKAAGYQQHTAFDDHLRRELGEQRWAKYAADPARVVCAALITDAAAAGRDMHALLSRAADIRGWEEDPRSPARSIARVLAYRIKNELEKPATRQVASSLSRTSSGSSAPPVTSPIPPTPWDDHLRHLLGASRWNQYAIDERRRDVAEALARAHATGHDVTGLLTSAVTVREWEDDPRSPGRRVGGVLLYRIKDAIASGEFANNPDRELPGEVAEVVANATATASGHSDGSRLADRSGGQPLRQVRQPAQRDLE